VNDKLDALKTLTGIMGMNLEMIACDKEFALSPNDAVDFFDKLLLPSPAPLKDLKAAKGIVYTIKQTGKEALEFVATDEQTVRAGAGGAVVLTVRPLAAPKGDKFPYAGSDAALRAALKPTQFLQCDDPRVAALAKEAVAGAKDSAEAVSRIEKFVRRHITKKDLSVGYASAAEVAQSRQGDCTEHAVLAAAMCRSAGIPAQVVAGLAYAPAFAGKKDVFVPHEWARAWIGGKWVSLDAALDGFDAGHIALCYGDGEAGDFFGAINLLGNFRIEAVKVEAGP
jgi:transglutaminase-like putative cysteine protease